jgi:hypothetical protein
MRWKPESKPAKPQWRWTFPLITPVVLDDGTRILWEWVQYRTVITREWGGMGADGCEGYTEYRTDPKDGGVLLGQVTWAS